MKKMKKIKDILKKTLVRDVFTNLIYTILVIMYVICFNTQSILLDSKVLIKYINISSMTFLAISIVMFEVGYRKDKTKIFIYGLEYFTLAIFILLIRHIPRIFGCETQDYTEIVAYIFICYYILKSAILYTIEKYNKLKNLSDIKEIVKEEPTKKLTKRKNKKVEEGK